MMFKLLNEQKSIDRATKKLRFLCDEMDETIDRIQEKLREWEKQNKKEPPLMTILDFNARNQVDISPKDNG